MQRNIKNVLILTLIAALALPAIGLAQLLPAAASDLAADSLTAAPRLKGMNVPREAVRFSWPLAGAADALSATPPTVTYSKEYFVDVTVADLRKGVPVYTSSPGALVRLNPAAGQASIPEKAAIMPASLVLVDAAGKSWGGGSGMDLMVGPEQLEAAGAPFAEGTSAFRIREELGAGNLQLRAEGLATSSGRYVLHVFDRGSAVSLELTTGARDYLHGQTLTVDAALTDGASRLPARSLEGFVTSPGGRAWPLRFSPGDKGTYRASLTLDAVELPAPGLWQVHVTADGHAGRHAILRAGRTAFACAVPSARFTGKADVAADGLGFRLDVDAASAGRYEARGVLWGTADDGTLQPAGIAHSAAWLEAGSGALDLTFDRAFLTAKELGAPFELRDLRLIDQVSMGLLHRQERALAVGR